MKTRNFYTYQPLIDIYNSIVDDYCGGYSLKNTKIGLFSIMENDALAELYFLLLSAQHFNVLAKMHNGSMRTNHYAKKYYFVTSALKLCMENQIKCGVTKNMSETCDISHIVYFDVPEAGQISFHMNFIDEEASRYPEYTNEWDGLDNSTFDKLREGICKLFLDKFDSDTIEYIVENKKTIMRVHKKKFAEYIEAVDIQKHRAKLRRQEREKARREKRDEKLKKRRDKIQDILDTVNTPEAIKEFLSSFKGYAQRKNYIMKYIAIKYDDNGMFRTEYDSRRFNYVLNRDKSIYFLPKPSEICQRVYGTIYVQMNDIVCVETGLPIKDSKSIVIHHER